MPYCARVVIEMAASKTALLVTAYRARATARGEPVCSDPWAAALAGEEAHALTERYDRFAPSSELYVAVRTAFIDAQVRRTAAKQVVILGAGLDTRAARLARSDVRFFEVDRPESQAVKLERLRTLPGYPVAAATYVACEFGRDDFLDRLAGAGFLASEPAFFVWEGVTYYLEESVVRSTCRRIAQGCEARSVLLFDSIMKKLAEGRRVSADQKEMLALLGELGEPYRFGTNDPLPLLYEEGFRWVKTTSFDEACLALTGTYERGREFRFQHLVMCSRTPP